MVGPRAYYPLCGFMSVDGKKMTLGARAWSDEDPHLAGELISAETLSGRVSELGAQISRDYLGKSILLVGVLKGAFLFMSDLAREIEVPVEFDFMAVSSYGAATQTSGVVRILKDLDSDLVGKHVLIVEDIIDSGLTLSYLIRNLRFRNPASLAVCALLVKDGAAAAEMDINYVGFNIPAEFVVGYGLDVAERYRNLPYIATYRERVP